MSEHRANCEHATSEVCWVSLADGTELVAARCDDVHSLVGADVVLVRDRYGKLRAGRFVTDIADVSPIDDELFEVVGVRSVAAAGDPIEDLIDLEHPGEDSQVGIMGLPQGWRTNVTRRQESRAETAFDIAVQSAGFRLYLDDPWLRVAPGDTVMVAGESVTVIAVDTRSQTVEVQQCDGSETYEVAFTDADPEEERP